MTDLWPLQQAVYVALTGPSPPLYPVYDAVLQGALKPYIVIGEFAATPDEEMAAASSDASVTLHAWSSKPGKAQVHAMLEHIRVALDGVEAEGGEWWAGTEEFAEIMEDPKSTADKRLYHGVARWRFRTD